MYLCTGNYCLASYGRGRNVVINRLSIKRSQLQITCWAEKTIDGETGPGDSTEVACMRTMSEQELIAGEDISLIGGVQTGTRRCCRPSLFRLFGAILCLTGMIAACK